MAVGLQAEEFHTLRAASCTFGFLLPMRFLMERMASFGCTVLERMMSEISRLSAMSSLPDGLAVAMVMLQGGIQAGRGGALDLLVQSGVGRREPAGHGAGESCGAGESGRSRLGYHRELGRRAVGVG